MKNQARVHLWSERRFGFLDGVWRPNMVRVSAAESRARLERKQPQRRWPGVS